MGDEIIIKYRTHYFNIDIEERNLSSGDWSKEQLLEAVPTARTVPQIFLDDQLIGGFQELKQHLG